MRGAEEALDDTLRLPPHSLDSEQAVLGAALISTSAAERVVEALAPGDYYHNAHSRIHAAIAALIATGKPVDPLTLSQELTRQNALEAVGGLPYLLSLSEAVPTASHVEHYCEIVREASVRRRLIQSGQRLIESAFSPDRPMQEVLRAAEKAVLEVGESTSSVGLRPMFPELLDAIQRLQAVTENDGTINGLPTGYEAFDRLSCGLQPSDLVIVAGRPGMGKTALALSMALCSCQISNLPVALFSLEMSASQLANRLLASEARVDVSAFRSGRLRSCGAGGQSDTQNLGRALARLSELPLYVDDSTELPVSAMWARCRRLQREVGPIGLVVVDYLQLARGEQSGRGENRTQEISAIARSLKSLARDLNCPVLALSQLSRAVEQRPNKRPMLSDLRESGSIEAEADLVLLLFRESYYRNNGMATEGEETEITDLILAKHRNGPTGVVYLGFQPRLTRFVNLTPEDHQRIATERSQRRTLDDDAA